MFVPLPSECLNSCLYRSLSDWVKKLIMYNKCFRKFACSRCSTGTDNLCDCGLGTILDVSPNAPSVAGNAPSRITPLPGVAASAGSKRRRKDLKDEAAQAESINCIAQRLAEMPSPLSSKRICRMPTVAEITDPMEEIDADVPEVTGLWEQFDQTGVTDEVMQTSVCTQVSLFFRVGK
jgi:DCN1-like protein 1/2